MSFANRYNKGNKFNIDTTGYNYLKLSELDPEKVYVLRGLFINSKGAFGPSPVAIIEGNFVNLPQHTLSVVQDMLLDDETVATIKAGSAGFKLRKYTDSNGKDRLSVEWMDV